jgi:hypothetical protein
MVTTEQRNGVETVGRRGIAAEPVRGTMVAYLDALRTGGDYGRFFSDDVAFTLMDTGETTRGRGAVVNLIDYLHGIAFAATPQFAPPVVLEVRAMLEAVFVATHTGEFAGIAPTRRPVRVPYAVAYDLAGGTITALRAYLPMDALIRQLRDA